MKCVIGWAFVAICTILAGCAGSPYVLLQQQYHDLPDDQLLAYYYRLQNATGDSDRGVSVMQSQYAADRFFGGPNRALGNVIVQGIIAGGGSALRERAVVVRVELERRGWTPAKGLPQNTDRGQPALPYGSMVERGAPTFAVGATSPVGATPAVAGIKGESKYMVTAEGVAKASGCAPPSTAMTAKGAGSESFMVGCPNGTTIAIRCVIDGCRILR